MRFEDCVDGASGLSLDYWRYVCADIHSSIVVA